jgi:hypothetical protein
MLKVTPHRCHPEKRAVGERAVGKQARKYSLIPFLTQPPHERTLTGRGSGCTLKVGAAGCTLTVGAAYKLYSGLHPKQGYPSPGTKKSM